MDGNRLLREIPALLFFFAAVFIGVSLAGYSPLDPTLNLHPGPGHEVQNLAGTIGAYVSGTFVELFGLGALIWPLVLLYFALVLFRPAAKVLWWRWPGAILLYMSMLVWAEFPLFRENISVLEISGGGFFGLIIFSWSFVGLDFWGTILVNLLTTLLGLQIATGFSWAFMFSRAGQAVVNAEIPGSAKNIKKSFFSRKSKEKSQEKKTPPPSEASSKKNPSQTKTDPGKNLDQKDVTKFSRPPLDLLARASTDGPKVGPARLEEMAQTLKSCLEDFSVQGEVQHVQPGPVVTMFEYKPAPGIKISRIANLGDDLALALKATAVRIVAPIPGKDSIGVEIPNEHRQMVYLREIFEHPSFARSKFKIPLALGKDIQGQAKVEDLSRMP
ncbi:MAG: DNA translocase FtsK 4TM domain-containing protein, partial [Desulfovibrionales bacterium]|nr:DNA translocase FtsK 4TM domain-containing protein [Desulfovibrionales bacterium]